MDWNYKMTLADVVEKFLKSYTPCSRAGFLGYQLIKNVNDEGRIIDQSTYPRTMMLLLRQKLNEERGEPDKPVTSKDINNNPEYNPDEGGY